LSLRHTPLWPALLFFAAAGIAGFFLDGFWLSLLVLVFYYALVGMAWNLMMGYAGMLSIGHALYLGTSAYATAILDVRYGVSPWIALPVGAMIAGGFGTLIAWLSSRFRVAGVYFALLTIAFAEFMRVLFDNWDFVGGPAGFFLPAIRPETNHPLLSLRGDTRFFYFTFLVATVLTYVLIAYIMRSRRGYWWLSLREDEDAARALGVPAMQSRMLVSFISAALTGVAGGLFGLMQGSLFPDSTMGMRLSIEVMIAPIIGGLGTLFGPIIGAFFVVPMMEIANSLGQSSGLFGLNTLIYGCIVLIVIVYLPDGIWPRLRDLWKRWAP
jgi:branched-chain amino acid transport system permease protein